MGTSSDRILSPYHLAGFSLGNGVGEAVWPSVLSTRRRVPVVKSGAGFALSDTRL